MNKKATARDIFVDSDIIIDLLSNREPFFEAASKLFSRCDKGKISISVSSLSFSNVYYLLRKKTNSLAARNKLLQFKSIIRVCSVNEKIIDLALTSEMADFEDAIQYYTALENNIPILITRNLKDYKKAMISAMTAETYLKTY